VSELKIVKFNYQGWNECIGSFLQVMGPENFFKITPMRLIEFDMNSLKYA